MRISSDAVDTSAARAHAGPPFWTGALGALWRLDFTVIWIHLEMRNSSRAEQLLGGVTSSVVEVGLSTDQDKFSPLDLGEVRPQVCRKGGFER